MATRLGFRLIISFAASVAAFVAGLLLNQSSFQPPDTAQAALLLEDKIHTAEAELDAIFHNASFLLQATENILPEDSIKKYSNKPYTILIYNDLDSLVYWNNNVVLPYSSDVKFAEERLAEIYPTRGGSQYLKIQQPYELMIKGQPRSYSLLAMIPLYIRYPIQNEYLQDRFPLMPDYFADYFELNSQKTDYPIHDKNGEVLTYLSLITKDVYPHYPQIYWVFILYLFSFILLIATLHVALYQRFILNNAPYKALGIFTALLLAFRIGAVVFGFPQIETHIPVFELLFGEGCFFWFRSLGDWMLDVGLLFWWGLFLHQAFAGYPQVLPGRWMRYVWAVGSYGAVVVGVLGGQWMFNDLSTQVELSFEFSDFSHVDRYSIVALLGLVAQFTAFFLITHRLFSVLYSLSVPPRHRLFIFALVLVPALLAAYWRSQSWESGLILSFAAGLYAGLIYFFVRLQYGSLLWTNVWLMFFSIFITVNLEENARQKDLRIRQEFAEKVAMERDERLEMLFKRIEADLLQDSYIKIYYSSPYVPSSSVLGMINYRYLDNNFFGYYNYTINIFDRNGNLPDSLGQWRDYTEYQRILESPHTKKTLSPYLYFYSNPNGTFSYIAFFPIKEKENLLGTIVIEFTPKNDQRQSNIYVELLSLTKSRKDELYRNFSYALYKNGRLVMNRGSNFSATFNNDTEIAANNAHHQPQLLADKDGMYYLMYRAPNGYVAVVTVPMDEFWKPVSVFSYIYCMGIFILLIIIAINQFISKFIGGGKLLDFHFEDSLRERIQRGIITVSLTSFIAVAFISILYFQAEYTEYHKERLKRKVDSTVKMAAWQIRENPSVLSGNILVQTLSDIQKIDINLYDLAGKLITSSESAIFDRQLISSQMHPLAYHKLLDGQNEVIQTEKINDFEYLAAYVPLRDRNQHIIAYLYLPYDLAVDNVARLREVADFLSALLNVYVIFLLIAGAVAFIIANSVTSPLLVISDKLNNLKLGAKNEPIEWKNQDEIGELVRQYNQMIEALEESTQQLKRSQRETAWREMAKQVAHEIKNPLTPMKLNIQMLQRIATTDPEKAQRMTIRLSNTLIEQIDNLARIASEFSNFAKMPAAENEVFNLNDLVINVYNLFREEENMQLSIEIPDADTPVYADKNQVLRVLNNLVKNAIQAIPSERAGQIAIRLSTDEGGIARVEVRDNGSGISPERRDDIFVPNFTTKSSGSGIGLSMSKSIIEMARGRIYFQSEEHIGTSFFVELPIYTGA